jgi:hypothetical protein
MASANGVLTRPLPLCMAGSINALGLLLEALAVYSTPPFQHAHGFFGLSYHPVAGEELPRLGVAGGGGKAQVDHTLSAPLNGAVIE